MVKLLMIKVIFDMKLYSDYKGSEAEAVVKKKNDDYFVQYSSYLFMYWVHRITHHIRIHIASCIEFEQSLIYFMHHGPPPWECQPISLG